MRIAIATFALAACTADPANTVVLAVSHPGATGQGVDLATLAITEESAPRTAVDFCVGQAMVISLRGMHDATFCGKGRDFASLADIPTETTTCLGGQIAGWSPIAYLSGTSEHDAEDSYVAGDGFLVRGRDEVSLYRMRILHDAYRDQTAVVTLEVEPVP